jgi:TPR repeat protein
MKRGKNKMIEKSLKLIFMIMVLPTSACTPSNIGMNENNNVEKKEVCEMKVDLNNVNEFLLNKLFECGRISEAFSIIKFHDNNFTIDERVGIGALLFDYGYTEQALSYLEDAANKNNAEALYRLGYLYNFSKKYKNTEKSILFFEKAIEFGYYDAFYNLGDIFLFEDEYINIGLSKHYFKESFKNGNYRSYYGLGEISLREGNYDSAEKYFNLCLEKGYDFEGYNGLLNLYFYYNDFKGHDVDKAKEYLDIILKMDNSQKYLIAYEFYKSNSKFKSIETANYYKKIADEKEIE